MILERKVPFQLKNSSVSQKVLDGKTRMQVGLDFFPGLQAFINVVQEPPNTKRKHQFLLQNSIMQFFTKIFRRS